MSYHTSLLVLVRSERDAYAVTLAYTLLRREFAFRRDWHPRWLSRSAGDFCTWLCLCIWTFLRLLLLYPVSYGSTYPLVKLWCAGAVVSGPTASFRGSSPPFLSYWTMGNITDKVFGATVLGFSVALWLYYTVWVILTVRADLGSCLRLTEGSPAVTDAGFELRRSGGGRGKATVNNT